MISKPRHFFSELYRRSPALAVAGWIQVGCLALMVIASFYDQRLVTGINPWIKPSKFALAIGLYFWTVAWLSAHLQISREAHRAITGSIALVMSLEIALIILQAARGVPSHFNTSTFFNDVVFTLMGILIFFNSLLSILLLILFFARAADLSPVYLWGIRLGLLIFILSSLQGYVMVAMRAHTVGLPDGGPGLPLLNWSTRAGDLRITHFLGLHALQIFPFLGYVLSKCGSPRRVLYLTVAALLYFLVLVLILMKALHGLPLFS